jgi:hypothetical protein
MDRSSQLTSRITTRSCETKLKAEVLQQQWRRNLGIQLNLLVREFSVWNMVLKEATVGMDFAILPNYFDPNPFLDPFVTPGAGNPALTDPAILRCSRMRDIESTGTYGEAG